MSPTIYSSAPISDSHLASTLSISSMLSSSSFSHHLSPQVQTTVHCNVYTSHCDLHSSFDSTDQPLFSSNTYEPKPSNCSSDLISMTSTLLSIGLGIYLPIITLSFPSSSSLTHSLVLLSKSRSISDFGSVHSHFCYSKSPFSLHSKCSC